MNRSIAIASMVGGVVLAIGMLVVPFSAEISAATPPADGAESAPPGDAGCGNLVMHYVSGSSDPACDSAANDRALLVAAGFVAAVTGWWTFQRFRSSP